WHHVAGTYDGAKLQLYIDGKPWGNPAYHSGIISPMLANSFVAIGSETGRMVCPQCTGSRFFNGLIDEPSIYNRALSASEIHAIYSAGVEGKCYSNQFPTTGADAFTTPSNAPVSFSAAKLLLNDSDPDGDALKVISVSSPSAQGGSVSLVTNAVTYTPAAGFTGNDLFSYTVSDNRGGSAVGTVAVTVGHGGTVSLNVVFGPINLGGNFLVQFAGIPGLTYTVEVAPGLSGPWTKAANLTAPTTNTGLGIGVFQFLEPIGTNSTRFYRTVYPAY
ncbi:MAG TPA: Ig-like domain-containing protein, partial [Candidatus Paceibacterota bacterium]|nr:Ig-like domain-containing protein [Candidatus Paceibacterota bacterium]